MDPSASATHTSSTTNKGGRIHPRKSEAATAKELYSNLADTLNSLAGNYDALHSQAMQVALLGTEIGDAQDIKDFRQKMREQDHRQKEDIKEIQNIIDDLLQKEGADMRQQVNQEIADQIDELVKEQVAQCLRAHLPEDLQLELARNKREYEELQLALHNSESRRTNGTLRANKADDALCTILTSHGNVSPHFPKDLKGLFSLHDDAVKALMVDYGLPDIGDSRDANLNKLMQFCGVRYQLVKANNAKQDNSNAAL